MKKWGRQDSGLRGNKGGEGDAEEGSRVDLWERHRAVN